MTLTPSFIKHSLLVVELILGFRKNSQHDASTLSNVSNHHPWWKKGSRDGTNHSRKLQILANHCRHRTWSLPFSGFPRWVDHTAWAKALLAKRNMAFGWTKAKGWQFITPCTRSSIRYTTIWNKSEAQNFLGHKTYSTALCPKMRSVHLLLNLFTFCFPVCLAAAFFCFFFLTQAFICPWWKGKVQELWAGRCGKYRLYILNVVVSLMKLKSYKSRTVNSHIETCFEMIPDMFVYDSTQSQFTHPFWEISS